MLTYLFLGAVGVIAGAMNAIAGGGMLLGFPALLSAGLPALVANATSNITVLPGILASVYGYRKYLHKVPRLYVLLLIPCAIGAAIGVTILRHTSNDQFERIVPGLILFAVVLFAFQPVLHFHLHQHLNSRRKNLMTLLFLCLAVLPLAIYGGYFGAGFGFVMLAFLGFTNIHSIHRMNGLKNLAGATIAIVSILGLLSTHLIDWRHGSAMAVGNLFGGYGGAVLAQKVPSHLVRVIVIIIGVLTALHLGLMRH